MLWLKFYKTVEFLVSFVTNYGNQYFIQDK